MQFYKKLYHIVVYSYPQPSKIGIVYGRWMKVGTVLPENVCAQNVDEIYKMKEIRGTTSSM